MANGDNDTDTSLPYLLLHSVIEDNKISNRRNSIVETFIRKLQRPRPPYDACDINIYMLSVFLSSVNCVELNNVTCKMD